MGKPLFDRLGGFAVVSRIVLTLYGRLLDDDLTGPYFDGYDMARLVDHQTKFLAAVLGGPASYPSGQVFVVHRSLGISAEVFDRFKQVLRETLDDHSIQARDIEEVLQVVEHHRTAVVGDPAC